MRRTRPELRLATKADVEAFYGHSLEFTMRGYVVLLDGRPVALGGVTYHPGVLCAFAAMRDEMRPYKVSIMRFARKIEGLFGAGPGMAIADPDVPNSRRLIEWLGFEHVATSETREVFKWTR